MATRSNKSKVRLWLRSEKAMGLTHVVRPHAAVGASDSQPAAVNAPAPKPAPAPVVSAGAKPALRTAASPAPATTASDSSASQPATLAQQITATPLVELPVLQTPEKHAQLEALNQTYVSGCTRCRLSETRTHTVFGEGDVDAQIFFIGEGPGENEDLSGRPFVGRAGQLLDKMIGGMGLKREQVFIANIVKCRPPGNRAPAADEVDACTPYLVKQLEIIKPKVIVTLGLPATKYMLQTNLSMSRLRGQWQEWRGIKLMPTFHPAYVLRQYTPEVRGAVWSDLKKVMAELGMTPPEPR